MVKGKKQQLLKLVSSPQNKQTKKKRTTNGDKSSCGKIKQTVIKNSIRQFQFTNSLLQHDLRRLLLTWLVLALDVVAGDGAVAIEAHCPPEGDAASSHLPNLDLGGVGGFWANTNTHSPAQSTPHPLNTEPGTASAFLAFLWDPDPVNHLLEALSAFQLWVTGVIWSAGSSLTFLVASP